MKKIAAGIILILSIFFMFLSEAKAQDLNVPHWTKKSISVYIPQDKNSQRMRSAFTVWQEKLENKITFNFVNKPGDINVAFVNKVSGKDGPIGDYNVTVSGMSITKAKINIATRGQKKYSDTLVYKTMLHEVGHVLGLADNPRKKSSIMCMPITESQDILKIDVRQMYYVNNWSYARRRTGN